VGSVSGREGPRPARRTKIVCTLGPASRSSTMIERLVRAGMDCARLNFSHGSPEEHLKVIKRIREVSRRTGRLVAVMQDLPGPKLRVGRLKHGSLALKKGSRVVITTRAGDEDGAEIPIESEALSRRVRAGSKIFLSDGSIALKVAATTESKIECVCEVGGVLLSGKGINVPGVDLGLQAFTDRDRRHLAFGLEHGVDLVAVSFVRSADDVKRVRRFVKKGGSEVLIVAKIEKKEAVVSISEIASASDAVMVARGDLGVENPIEEVPEIQKAVIAHCRREGVPAITATQMLESMVNNSSPTRAEVTDVANAILDGTDAVMLSEETAIGQHPVACVEVMDRVAIKAEEKMLADKGMMAITAIRPSDLADAFSASVWRLSEDIGASAIVVQSGDEAIIPKVSRFRPSAKVVHISGEEGQLRRSKIVWGVFQERAKGTQTSESSFDSSVRNLLGAGYLGEGDRAVFVRSAGGSAGPPSYSLSALVATERPSAHSG
jgi:pyruvate kinase